MNDKDIGALRRRFKPDKNNISIIRGCYVNEKHEILSTFKSSMLSMPNEENEKYLAIFRKALTGTHGKNLIDVSYGTNDIALSDSHKLLSELRSTSISDDGAAERFFASAVQNLPDDDNYLILLTCDAYDLPPKSKDDDSWQTFTYMVCCICPVKNSKPSLSFCADDGAFHNTKLVREIGMPVCGFMFPAFEDGGANIYGALYYSKDGKGISDSCVGSILGVETPMPASEQRDTFCNVLGNALGDECSLAVVSTVHDRLCDIIEDHKQNRDDTPLLFTKHAIGTALEQCGVSDEKIQAFEAEFDSAFGTNAELPPQNIVGSGRMEVKMPDVVVNVNPTKGDLVETRVIGGIKYIMIRADDSVQVNGVDIAIENDAE